MPGRVRLPWGRHNPDQSQVRLTLRRANKRDESDYGTVHMLDLVTRIASSGRVSSQIETYSFQLSFRRHLRSRNLEA